MKHKTDKKGAANPRLAVLDFEVAFALALEDALADLHALVHDRASCLARITDLPGGKSFGGGVSKAALAEYRSEIQQLANGDLWQLLYEGCLSAEAVARLHRMTCEPDSLWTVHRAVLKTEEMPEEEDGTGVHGETKAEGLTSLARRIRDHAEDWPTFADRLRPWLPALFALAECPEPDAEVAGFLEFLQQHRERLSDQPLLEQLGLFAAEYLKVQGSSVPVSLETLVLARALLQIPRNAPAWAREFVAAVRQQRVQSLNGLLSVVYSAAEETALRRFRTNLYAQGKSLIADAEQDFHVA